MKLAMPNPERFWSIRVSKHVRNSETLRKLPKSADKGGKAPWSCLQFCATENVRRQHGKLGLGEYTTGIHLHHFSKLESCKFAVQVNDRSHAYELRVCIFLQNGEEDIGDEIDTFLLTPAAHKNKQICLGIIS